MDRGIALTGIITVVAVLLGGTLTLLTTWLANAQRHTQEARDRRRERLLALYLDVHLTTRDWVTSIENFALRGFPSQDRVEHARDVHRAREKMKRNGYRVDLMAPPVIACQAELLEDSLLRLSEELGFRLRINSVDLDPKSMTIAHVGERLRSISVLRTVLLDLMQRDLNIHEHSQLEGEGGGRALGRPKRSFAREDDALGRAQKRDAHGFLSTD